MKYLTILTLALILTIAATPAFAAPNENKSNNGNAKGQNKEAQAEKKAVNVTVQQEVTEVSIVPSQEPAISVAPSQTWKNHGAYVSSVAKTHPGGQTVSAAARSDIGKKQKSPTPSISVTPSASPSVVPSVEPSVVPTISTTPPITSPVEAFTFGNPLMNIMKFLQNVSRFLNPFDTA